MSRLATTHAVRGWLLTLAAAFLTACATMPPGADYPKIRSTALAHPEETTVGRSVEALAKAHPGLSGFRLFASGSDAFTLRIQMANRAERTLDVQYFIFKDDDTGQLLMSAMLHAASRGVRVRVLMDDSQARGQDDRVGLLAANPNVEVRLYNPFYYRGSSTLLRYTEFALTMNRLDYRMHNKLFVVDNAMAVVGGRNVGDEYFDMGDAPQFGDYDVFAMGPIVRNLSKSFDAYWNCSLSIPVLALHGDEPTAPKLAQVKEQLTEHKQALRQSDEERAIRTGNPLSRLLSTDSGVVWAKAEVLADSPDKASVEDGDEAGTLFRRRLLEAAAEAQKELLIVSPYFVPGVKGEALLEKLRARGVRVRVLTNSLLSTDVVAVHAGYRNYRVPLLKAGVELYEVKPLPGKPQPRGGLLKSPSSGQFSLHAKAFVFDGKRIFIGSANFDRRSLHLNTEIGLMIDSPELAQQVTKRFNTIANPANSFVLALQDDGGGSPHLVWKSVKDGKPIVYTREPGDGQWREVLVDLYDLLPIDDQL
ncbi:MAG TPA: phospholipase D family protein [Casimicrobiaceae bacterium]|jgi:putative cardiolipin synthase|nr:phospholipase D family protein [Casimicrobiaceae bacterium]